MQGCKPIKPLDIIHSSISTSPNSSYQPSRSASFHASPASSSLASPASSSFTANTIFLQGTSLIPWLKNMSSPASSSKLPHLCIHKNSISAPVTPALSSSPTSPTFSLVSSHHPFGGFFTEKATARGGGDGFSRMLSPLQSGTCSPAIPAGSDHTTNIPMFGVICDEFAFGSSANGLVKAWEGERIHEEYGSDDLDLTLGSSMTRYFWHEYHVLNKLATSLFKLAWHLFAIFYRSKTAHWVMQQGLNQQNHDDLQWKILI